MGPTRVKYCELHSISFSRTRYELHALRAKSSLLVVSPTNVVISNFSSLFHLMALVSWWGSIASAINECAWSIGTMILSFFLSFFLSPWSKVLLQKLTGSQLVKKFPAFYETRQFITAFSARSYRPYCRPLLRPQREDAPCRGDRDPPVTGWNDTDRVKPTYSENNLSQCHYVDHKSTWSDLGLNPFLPDERLLTNRLSRGTAVMNIHYSNIKFWTMPAIPVWRIPYSTQSLGE